MEEAFSKRGKDELQHEEGGKGRKAAAETRRRFRGGPIPGCCRHRNQHYIQSEGHTKINAAGC